MGKQDGLSQTFEIAGQNFSSAGSISTQIKEILHAPPALIAKVNIGDYNVDIASCHLYPSKDAKNERLFFLSKLKEHLTAETTIIMGDMNMRDNETKPVLQLGLDDVFLLGGSPKEKKFTWNSRENLFRKESYQFTCRFDRILTTGLLIKSFDLIGHKPIHPRHYLSDHYGIFAEVTFNENDSNISHEK